MIPELSSLSSNEKNIEESSKKVVQNFDNYMSNMAINDAIVVLSHLNEEAAGGKIDKEKRFIDENNIERTYARIALLMLTKRTLKSGLDILGVSAPEEMQ